MDRIRRITRNLFVPTSLREVARNYNAILRNYLRSRTSGYEEIGAERGTNWWIKLIIYLGSAVAIIGSIVAFAFGYVIIPTIATLTAIICATLFWFRYSIVWGRLLECFTTIFCFPCTYFKRPAPPHAHIRYERERPEMVFERSVELPGDCEDVQSEAETNAAEQSAAQNSSLVASSESESSTTIITKPVKEQNVTKV